MLFGWVGARFSGLSWRANPEEREGDRRMRRRLASWLRHIAEAVGGHQAVPARTEVEGLAVLMDHVERALRHARGGGGPEFAVLLVGLDRLPAINAGLRHAAVGPLLQSVVRRLQ